MHCELYVVCRVIGVGAVLESCGFCRNLCTVARLYKPGQEATAPKSQPLEFLFATQ